MSVFQLLSLFCIPRTAARDCQHCLHYSCYNSVFCSTLSVELPLWQIPFAVACSDWSENYPTSTVRGGVGSGNSHEVFSRCSLVRQSVVIAIKQLEDYFISPRTLLKHGVTLLCLCSIWVVVVGGGTHPICPQAAHWPFWVSWSCPTNLFIYFKLEWK